MAEGMCDSGRDVCPGRAGGGHHSYHTISRLMRDERNIHMHPASARLLRYFRYEHLPPALQVISKPCCELAHLMAETLPDDPEVTASLRFLLIAKDGFVRALLPEDVPTEERAALPRPGVKQDTVSTGD